MSYSVEYLTRNLSRRVQASYSLFGREIDKMMAHHADKGVLGSGATLRRFEEIAADTLKAWYAEASIFVYSLTGAHDTSSSQHLRDAARDLIASICIYTRERGKNTGLQTNMIEDRVGSIQALLNRVSDEQFDDFTHGMLGNSKMKKDPLVSLTATQTNSPGAIQQVGIDSHQSATVNYHSLVHAIDSIVASEEYRLLTPAQKTEFDDHADIIRAETLKADPDAGKLQRWGNKLQFLAQDFAMKVATSTLATVLSKLFVG